MEASQTLPAGETRESSVLEIRLRPDVVFSADDVGAGTIEFPRGRRFDNVRFRGTLPGTTDNGALAHVSVLSAVYPTLCVKSPNSDLLPVLVVVPAETRYLKGPWLLFGSLYFLTSVMEDGCELAPAKTVVLTMHGSAEIDVDDQLVAGNPTLPSLDPKRWITLDPASVATLVRRVRGPDGQRPNAVVNAGCFSSTRRGRRKGATFNEELAALLAADGVTVYGPPYAGIVTAADWLGRWMDFGQRLEDDKTIREVPIKFQKIEPTTRPQRRGAQTGRRATSLTGSLVITNNYTLAAETGSYSPDFAEPKKHDIDRTMLE